MHLNHIIKFCVNFLNRNIIKLIYNGFRGIFLLFSVRQNS